MTRQEKREATEKAQETFLKNYFERVTDDECKGRPPYVCIGKKNGNFYFIRPTNVMSKESFCDPYVEKDGFSYFAYNPINEKLTQGHQCAFVDSTKLGLNGIPEFDLDFVSTELTKFELNRSLDELFKAKNFEGFSESAKKELENEL